jgi:AbrB family looped-hinge helix DNA binding protein
MQMTSKGQVTVPQELRNKLGLLPGVEVIFEIKGSALLMRRAPDKKNSRGKKIVGLLEGKGTGTMSTNEILALTRARP